MTLSHERSDAEVNFVRFTAKGPLRGTLNAVSVLPTAYQRVTLSLDRSEMITVVGAGPLGPDALQFFSYN